MTRRFAAFSFLIAVISLAVFEAGAARETYRVGKIIIGEIWAAETPGKAKTGVVYFKLGNGGRKADTLIAASSPVADSVELRTHRLRGNVMRTQHVMGIMIGPGQIFTLKPGGTHVMLSGLKTPLQAGDRIPLTLIFKEAGAVQIHATVRTPPGVRGKPPVRGRGLESYRK